MNAMRDLSLAAAQQLLNYGLDAARTRGLNRAIAVVDRTARPRAFAHMDHAAIVTADIATGKARTAAYLKAPLKIFEDMINAGLPSMATTPGVLPLQSDMPVLCGEEVIRAAGVSGASGDIDQDIAAVIARSFRPL